MTVMQINPFLKTAMRQLKGIKLEQTDDAVVLNMLSRFPWFKVAMQAPVDQALIWPHCTAPYSLQSQIGLMHNECIAPIASSTAQDAIVCFECSCKNDTHGLDTLCSLEGGTSGEVRCYTQFYSWQCTQHMFQLFPQDHDHLVGKTVQAAFNARCLSNASRVLMKMASCETSSSC